MLCLWKRATDGKMGDGGEYADGGPTQPVTVNTFLAEPGKRHARKGGGWVKAVEEDG